jgi:hypothetical protein
VRLLFWIVVAALGVTLGWAAGHALRDRPPLLSGVVSLAVTPSRSQAQLATVEQAPQATPAKWLKGDGAITAVWASNGGDKVTQDERRTKSPAARVMSRTWDGDAINLFGAKNEVIAFNLVLETDDAAAENVSVEFNQLNGPEGAVIKSAPHSKDDLFSWIDRDIELFLVGYLPINGLSQVSYQTYDERHIPQRLQRPIVGGTAIGTWSDRPDHNKSYPDIAVPIELSPTFKIAPDRNQGVWVDIYIPKDVPSGPYAGTVLIRENGDIKFRVPVKLQVRRFTLPDRPTARTMVATSYHDVAKRYTGSADPPANSADDALVRRVLDRQMMVAHRHKISLIDDNGGVTPWPQDAPRPEWLPRLNGELFSKANGYRGPGENIGNGVFSIGTYGQWQQAWYPLTRATMWDHANKWESWFAQNAPDTEHFLYLDDESENYVQTQQWARWMQTNPGVGSRLKSFATADLPKANDAMPSLDITASWFRVGPTAVWTQALANLRKNERKEFYLYNGQRPASGSFAIEDDGVALRELAWAQYKAGVDRWFFWNATYYDDYQGGRGPTNVFKIAQTFGGPPKKDPILGEKSWNYGNGDGVLFYPGTDRIFPAVSLGLEGPIASLRLKYWRRGIQDVDYIAMAAKVDPAATEAIVKRMVPKVLWEYGVSDPADPTWVRADISWSTNPDDWEAARAELADIIERASE